MPQPLVCHAVPDCRAALPVNFEGHPCALTAKGCLSRLVNSHRCRSGDAIQCRRDCDTPSCLCSCEPTPTLATIDGGQVGRGCAPMRGSGYVLAGAIVEKCGGCELKFRATCNAGIRGCHDDRLYGVTRNRYGDRTRHGSNGCANRCRADFACGD